MARGTTRNPQSSYVHGLAGHHIACVGFSGQMHSAVMLDAAGNVVRPALIWCNVRTQKQCNQVNERIGAAKLIQLTCNPALTSFTLTKVLWIRENKGQNWKRVRSIMLPKDYVRLRLTGERATDLADASGTLMLDVSRGPSRRRQGECRYCVPTSHRARPNLGCSAAP